MSTELLGARVPSGVPGLDSVLGGGLLDGGTYLVMGPPGAGKTILANQIAFHHASQGGRVFYVSLLVEAHERLFQSLRSLRFFDERRLARSVVYVSGYQALAADGLKGLLALLLPELRERRTSLLVIDGLSNAALFAENDVAMKRFMHELQTLTALVRCTSVLLTTDPLTRPEHPMVDGIVELSEHRTGMRSMRELAILKLRGSGHMNGSHEFRIDDQGITVSPRIEALATEAPRASSERLGTGVARLDSMLGGGLAPGSATLIVGPSGSGKTMLGLCFLGRGAALAEPCLHFGFNESPAQLLSKARMAGIDLDRGLENGSLELLWQSAADTAADRLARLLLDAVRRRNVKRVVIDALRGFREASHYPERFGRFIAGLTAQLRAQGAAVIYVEESPQLLTTGSEAPLSDLSVFADNVVLVRQLELRSSLHRVVCVLKVREGRRDPTLRVMHIGPEGIEVGAPFETEGGVGEIAQVPAARSRED